MRAEATVATLRQRLARCGLRPVTEAGDGIATTFLFPQFDGTDATAVAATAKWLSLTRSEVRSLGLGWVDRPSSLLQLYQEGYPEWVATGAALREEFQPKEQ